MTRTATLLFFAPLLLLAQTSQPQRSLVISHVAVIDAAAPTAQSDLTVVITGDRIVAVGKKVPMPQNAEAVDGTGKFLIPGLWDMHSHIHRPEDLQLFLANGVTGLRIMAALPAVSQMRSRIENGQEVGRVWRLPVA